MDWEKELQLSSHYVYLANSSGIKVGITRGSQGVIRWMDQGASQAILLAEVPNRRFSGDIEVALKRYVNDGGYMADDEKNEYAMLYLETTQKENELQKLRVNLDALSEKEKEDSVTKVTLEIADLKKFE